MLEQSSSGIHFTFGMKNSDQAKRAVLGRIARLLGVPVDQFFAEAPSVGAASSADECLRLWSMIRTDEGRQQALKALQMILDLERAR